MLVIYKNELELNLNSHHIVKSLKVVWDTSMSWHII